MRLAARQGFVGELSASALICLSLAASSTLSSTKAVSIPEFPDLNSPRPAAITAQGLGTTSQPKRNRPSSHITKLKRTKANLAGIFTFFLFSQPFTLPDGQWQNVKCEECNAIIGRASPGPTRPMGGKEDMAYIRLTKAAVQPSSYGCFYACIVRC